MSISAAQVKELRDLTGAGMMDCKAALNETNGDMEAAVDWLRKKGISKADKKAGRTAAEGLIGVLVAIETTGNEHAANAFGRQVAMHVAATNPVALTAEEVDPALVEREKAIFSDQARQSGKPEAIIEKMVEGRLRRFYEEVVL